MKSYEFKKCNSNNWRQLKEISISTFLSAFGHLNKVEDMDAYICTAFSDEKIQAELKNPNSFFYFFKSGNLIVGYFKLNVASAQNELMENGIEVERIYILDAYQGRGIGQIMMNYVFELARIKNKNYLWLGVWDQNKGAIRFYEKNGFRKFGEHDFLLGNDEQTDWLMGLNLTIE